MRIRKGLAVLVVGLMVPVGQAVPIELQPVDAAMGNIAQPGDRWGSNYCTAGPVAANVMFLPYHCGQPPANPQKVDTSWLNRISVGNATNDYAAYTGSMTTSISTWTGCPANYVAGPCTGSGADLPVSGILQPWSGMTVYKSGATSGTSSGFATLDTSVPGYDLYLDGMKMCSGDSGSPLYFQAGGMRYLVGMGTNGNGSTSGNTVYHDKKCRPQAAPLAAGFTIEKLCGFLAPSAQKTNCLTEAGTPLGALEQVSSVFGAVRVKGWSIDPDKVGSAYASVDVTIDGVVVATLPANQYRADIAQTWQLNSAVSGFDSTVPASAGNHTVCVTAKNVAGTAGSNRLLNGPSCTLVNVLPPVAVTKLVATPATLLAAGTTTIVATTTSATNVAFSVSPAVAGFNGTVAVSGGTASKQLTLPANTTSAAKYYNVTATPDGVTTAAMTTSVMVAPAATGITLVTPARLVDTRPLPNHVGPMNRFAARTTQEVQVTNASGAPSSVPLGAVAVQVTATTLNAASNGYLTLYACEMSAPPLASTINFPAATAGATGAVANTTVVSLGASGRLCANSSAAVDLVLDVSGFASPTSISRYNPLSPARIIDTRPAPQHIGSTDQLVANTPVVITVAGVGGVPADATGVAMYVSAVYPAAAGWLSVYPTSAPNTCGTPTTSVVNFNPANGNAKGNNFMGLVGPGGQLCVQSSVATHLTIDVVGWVGTTGQRYQILQNVRALDTRPGPLTAGTQTVAVAGSFGVPPTATAVSANITVANQTANGYTLGYATGLTPPTATSVNFAAGASVACGAHIQLGSGQISLLTNTAGTYNLILDIGGAWVP